jgi:hypothetical protein
VKLNGLGFPERFEDKQEAVIEGNQPGELGGCRDVNT